ncbi:Mss4 protein-domain-containing protein [Gamsiella multidivaricata]|uniref:Mss4 protein-domain-containing protein n=1 Tax=Gamsiella multidivaricata TaxID=101098 RepID=UPI00222035B3|nr:Mss4 protein-domain-containing protein [Gamsiella multidivaricata]KAG0365601.1 hypothetical protein BGZ54_006384 [Gamsiella multidivaricata]KAI7825167.1 Mss4 protein-domain-containing protein [Gamsiella multidivaricata]
MAAAVRNPGKAYTEFQEQDLIGSHSEKSVNQFDIYCPQESCRCKILLASAATLVQREKSKLMLPKLPLAGATISTIDQALASEKKEGAVEETTKTNEENTEKSESSASVTATASSGDELQSFWRVTDMMAFENIGFSKMLPNGTQFLSCADCDTGPLGYHESKAPKAEKEYLVALNRVRYNDGS